MRDPKRLVEEGDEYERRILRAGVSDASPTRRTRNVAAAIGLGTLALGKAAPAAGSMASLGGAAAARAVGGWAVIKWMGVAAVAATATAGAVHFAARSEPPARAPAIAASGPVPRQAPRATPALRAAPEATAAPIALTEKPPPSARRAQSAASTVSAPHRAVPPAVPPPPSPDPPAPDVRVAEPAPDVRVAERAVPTREPPAAAPVNAPPSASSLMAETRALDEARAAERSGEHARALRALDAYDRSFPNGALAPEALLLRIEVFSKAGDRPAAQRSVDVFLRDYPDSPLVPRVRALAGSSSIP